MSRISRINGAPVLSGSGNACPPSSTSWDTVDVNGFDVPRDCTAQKCPSDCRCFECEAVRVVNIADEILDELPLATARQGLGATAVDGVMGASQEYATSS